MTGKTVRDKSQKRKKKVALEKRKGGNGDDIGGRKNKECTAAGKKKLKSYMRNLKERMGRGETNMKRACGRVKGRLGE